MSCAARCRRGTVTLEYTLVLLLVAVPALTATIALGASLLSLYLYQRAVLALPL